MKCILQFCYNRYRISLISLPESLRIEISSPCFFIAVPIPSESPISMRPFPSTKQQHQILVVTMHCWYFSNNRFIFCRIVLSRVKMEKKVRYLQLQHLRRKDRNSLTSSTLVKEPRKRIIIHTGCVHITIFIGGSKGVQSVHAPLLRAGFFRFNIQFYKT